MAELIIALAPLLGLLGLTLVALFVPLQILVSVALSLMGVGLLFGIPSGIYYHVVLRRELRKLGTLPRGWYWQPQHYHARLAPAAMRRLRPAFFAGALGFLLIVVGFLLAVTALLLWFREQHSTVG